MTVTDPAPATDQPGQTPDAGPSLGEQLAQLAVVETLRDAFSDRAKALRAAVTPRMVAEWRKGGAKKYAVRIPGLSGSACSATLTEPQATAALSDRDAFLRYVSDHYPSEVTRTVTITIPEGFGADVILQRITEAVSECVDQGAAHMSVEQAVRAAFERAFLAAKDRIQDIAVDPDDPQGETRQAVVDVDRNSGELIEVPGLRVVPAADPDSFSMPDRRKAAPRIMEALGGRPVRDTMAVTAHERDKVIVAGQDDD